MKLFLTMYFVLYFWSFAKMDTKDLLVGIFEPMGLTLATYLSRQVMRGWWCPGSYSRWDLATSLSWAGDANWPAVRVTRANPNRPWKHRFPKETRPNPRTKIKIQFKKRNKDTRTQLITLRSVSYVLSHKLGPRNAVWASTLFQSSPSSFLSSPNMLPAKSLIVEWPWPWGWVGLLFPGNKGARQELHWANSKNRESKQIV